MTKIIWDEGFKRSYKRKVKVNKRLKKKFWIAMETFEKIEEILEDYGLGKYMELPLGYRKKVER